MLFLNSVASIVIRLDITVHSFDQYIEIYYTFGAFCIHFADVGVVRPGSGLIPVMLLLAVDEFSIYGRSYSI